MRVLIVGNLNEQLSEAARIAFEKGAKVSHAASPTEALDQLMSGRGAEMILIDIDEPIADLAGCLRRERIVTPIVACGTRPDADRAAAAIRAGAREFIPLPPEPGLIAAILAAVAEEDRPVIATGEAMRAVMETVDQVASSTASVMICGESGVGKEVLARHLHTRSARAQKPFISVNCAAIPENLLESEMFGHEKGAFTGALARRVGKFEEADKGSLLLDEVTEMDARLQAKLLRAVQEREIDRVGGSRPVPVDIRIISTSNRDLDTAVRENRFREDLLYRLNVISLHIPPLRERPEDIVALGNFFVRKYAKSNGLPVKSISDACRDYMVGARWPGNVRQLENAMHRAVILSRGDSIEPEALGCLDGGKADADQPSSPRPQYKGAVAEFGRTVAEMERDLILTTLDHCFGNRTHAATILGISIRTLRNKLRAYSGAGEQIAAPGQRRAMG